MQQETLDFGHTVPGRTYKEALVLTNHDARKPLPVTFQYHSDQLELSDTVLAPGATARVPLVFRPQRRGDWAKRVVVSAPNLRRPLVLPVRSHVGSVLSLNVAPGSAIVCPPVAVGSVFHLALPVTNLARGQLAEFMVEGLKRTPFWFRVQPLSPDRDQPGSGLGLSSREYGQLSALMESELHTKDLDKAHAQSFKLPEQGTALLHIWFVSHSPGCFVVPFSLRLIYPWSDVLGPFLLKVCVCVMCCAERCVATRRFASIRRRSIALRADKRHRRLPCLRLFRSRSRNRSS